MLDFMQVEMLLQRAWQVLPLAKIWAHSTGNTTPVIDAVRSASSRVTSATVIPAYVTVGTYTFTTPVGAMPALPGQAPSGPIGTVAHVVKSVQTANVTTVRVYNAAGALTDSGAFWVDVYGE
jgi:hypothetical protein